MTGKPRTLAPPAKAPPAPLERTRSGPRTTFPNAPEASRERGNRLHGFLLRTRMAVGSPDDPQEGQAQRMAERAMSDSIEPSPPSQSPLSPVSPQPPPNSTVDRPWGHSGLPLSPHLRGFFEPRLRFDFSGVRIHDGPEAAAASFSIGARAFTYGSDIVFGSGHWRPETWEGRRLLAHELAHVIQGRGLAPGIIRRDLDDDLALEVGAMTVPEGEGEEIPAEPLPEVEELDYAFLFAGGSYGGAARAFLRAYRPGHRLVEAHSFEALFDALHADLRRRRRADRRLHVREIVLVAHANRDGGLRIALSREDVGRDRFFNPWHVRDLQSEFREGEHGRFRSRRHEVVTEMFDSATRILVRGCEFGESDEGLQTLRLLFGGEPEVWAPRGYQGFETLRIGGSLLRTPEQAYDFLVEQGYLPLDGADVSDAEKRAYIARVFGSSGLIPADFFVMDGEDYAGLHAEMDAGRGTGEIAEGFKTRGVSDIPSAGEYWNLSASDPLGSDPELDALSLDEIESRALALNSPYSPRHAAMLQRLRRAWERKGLEILDRGDADDPLAGLPPEAIFGDPNIVDMDAHRYPGPPRPSADAFDTAILPLPPSEAHDRGDVHDATETRDADRGSAYALSLDFSKSMRPPPPLEAPASGPERPRSLDGSLDTMDLSGRELEREVALLVAWLEVHSEDSEENLRLRSDLTRLSRELDHRSLWLEGSELMVREGDLALLFTTGLEQHFLQGFLAAAAFELRPRDLIRFSQDLLLPSLSHRMGMGVGVVQGVGEDLYSNLAGLIELLSLLDPTLALRLMAEEAVDYIRDPEAYGEELNRHIHVLQEVVGGIQEFIAAVLADPRLLVIQSRALGVEAGLRAADYFNDGYMAQDDFDRGRDLGRIQGMILTEIALLFLGPEEWIGRAATAAGQATRLAGEVTHVVTMAATRVRGASRGILRIMEEIPGLRRALRAFTEWDSPGRALSEATGIAPALRGADEVTGGPIRGVIEGGGESTARRHGHLSVVPDSPPRDPAPIPEAPAMPVAAEAETSEALDMASGGETFSRGRHADAPRAMAEHPPRSREGATVIDMTSRRRTRPGGSGPLSPPGAPGPSAPLDSPSPLSGGSALTAAESRLSHAEPGTLAFDDLFDETGQFLHLNPETNPERYAEIERLRELYRRHGRSRTNPRDWLMSTRSEAARSILDGGLLAPNWRHALMRSERLAAARRLIPDPEPWLRISDLEARFPALRDSHLIPVRRDFTRPGMVEESLWTDLGDYSFEGLYRDGRSHQIDGFDELGRLIEHKSRTDPEFVARETEALSLGRRQHAIEILRDIEFAREAGLPGVVWQTDSLDLAVELRIIAGEEGLMAREGDSGDFFRVLLLH